MNGFYKESISKKILKKIGLVTIKDHNFAIEKETNKLNKLNSFLKKLANKAANGKIHVVNDYERLHYEQYDCDVFVVGDGSIMNGCSVSGSIHISPMAKCNMLSCIQFKDGDEQ